MRRILIWLVAALIGVPCLGWFQQPGTAPIRFRNMIDGSGIDFVLENSPTDRKHLVETMAGGVAVFDYDDDGRPDIFFTNGAALPALGKDGAQYRNRLYRNLGNFRFADVTDKANLGGSGYSIGVAAADYDNDGHVDLFVAGVGQNLLYRNRGDGTFEDVTARSGVAGEPWSVGAAWLDYDNDGLLDLFVVNYLRWSPDFNRFCGSDAGVRTYCHPRFFEGLPNRLYHNEGNGRFRDVSQQAGIAAHVGKGMGAAIGDYDRDGRPDIYVTNDKLPNFLFHNLGGGRFEEAAFETGAALLDSGNEVSGMGVDFRDINNDGLPDLVVTALAGETFPAFLNRAGGHFEDAGHTSGLAAASRVYSGWGLGVFDLDNDGRKDLFSANSHVDDHVDAFEATTYKQHNAVFLNRANGGFEDVSAQAGSEFQIPRAHRGCAFADFDGDGRVDVLVTALEERPELWKNVSLEENSWVKLRLVGTKSNRDGIGAEVQAGDQWNAMTSAVGYASSSHAGVHFGFGRRTIVPRIEIRWPSGLRQELTNVATNRVITVHEKAE